MSYTDDLTGIVSVGVTGAVAIKTIDLVEDLTTKKKKKKRNKLPTMDLF